MPSIRPTPSIRLPATCLFASSAFPHHLWEAGCIAAGCSLNPSPLLNICLRDHTVSTIIPLIRLSTPSSSSWGYSQK